MKYICILICTAIQLSCLGQEISNVLNLEFYLPEELENWYSENYEKNMPSQTWVLCEIYSEPNSEAIKVGQMISYYEPDVSNFIVQFLSSNGTVKKELRNIGDWGYGIHLNVIESTKEFARLPESYFGNSAWVRMGNQPQTLNAGVSSYVEEIIYLPGIKATTYPSGELTTLKSGNYVVEKYEKGVYIIREEVPTDMPCGDEVPPTDLSKVARYKLPIKSLMDAYGEIVIEIAYPRGC